jgi:hypothetical protein
MYTQSNITQASYFTLPIKDTEFTESSKTTSQTRSWRQLEYDDIRVVFSKSAYLYPKWRTSRGWMPHWMLLISPLARRQHFDYESWRDRRSGYGFFPLSRPSVCPIIISRFHIRRRTSRLDEQIVSKSSFSRTNHQMWKLVVQNFRRTSRLNLFDYLSVCGDDFWETICSSRRLVRL